MDADHHVPDPPSVLASDEAPGPSSASPALPRPSLHVRGDRGLLRAAAWGLRHAATQDVYRGHCRPEHAYALASLVDTAEVRWQDQDDELREAILRCCRTLLDVGDDFRSG